jgi:hypothetical protein
MTWKPVLIGFVAGILTMCGMMQTVLSIDKQLDSRKM